MSDTPLYDEQRRRFGLAPAGPTLEQLADPDVDTDELPASVVVGNDEPKTFASTEVDMFDPYGLRR